VKARTVAGLLRERAQSRPEQLALRLREGGGWTEWTWADYWEAARAAQAGFRGAGVRPGHHVLMIVPEVRPAVASLFGLWALGAVPIQVGLPLQLRDRQAFAHGLAETAARLDARLVVWPASFDGVSWPGPGRALTVDALAGHAPEPGLPDADEARGAAFIQLTSGTTRRPRGVVITHDRLLLHMEAMSAALPSHAGSVGVSWLPLHHDMGLLGGLLFPFFNGFVGHMISTADFQRQPSLWLDTVSRFRATITAAPPSAYALCVPLAPRLLNAGLDLGALDCAMVGAEPISAGGLGRFARAFAGAGFRPEALFPVYGLAEATVAVTFPEPRRPVRVDRVDRDALQRDGRALAAGDGGAALDLVCVGRPLPGSEVRIVDAAGASLPERSVGEIEARSASLMWGYYADAAATRAVLAGGWLRTGDLGYLADGELFVTGRRKELIIKGGHNLIPSALEEAAQAVEGVRAAAAVGVRSESRQTDLVCLAAETRLPAAQHGALGARLRAALAAAGVSLDRVVLLPPHGLPRTTSGKVQRLALARLLEEREAESTAPAAAAL
jgi:acyl-CoA synthetase (AMP-forming)/AMP-acid ligase II